jgi:membrane associated rhomboid family serine protease
MRTFEFVIALIAAVIVFVVLKLIGLIVKFALIAAIMGFIAGLVLARAVRPHST